jgi:hypothetical protein
MSESQATSDLTAIRRNLEGGMSDAQEVAIVFQRIAHLEAQVEELRRHIPREDNPAVTASLAVIRRLRQALKPFAELAVTLRGLDQEHPDEPGNVPMKAGWLQEARKAWENTK